MRLPNPHAEHKKFFQKVKTYKADRARGVYAYCETPENVDPETIQQPYKFDPASKMICIPLGRVDIPYFDYYGPIAVPDFNMIAACYKGQDGKICSYGNTITEARRAMERVMQSAQR